jgi:L-methionine (R)-S-oxide reductase
MNKQKKYERLYEQLSVLLRKRTDIAAQMATINAVLYHKFDYFFWCGFYRLLDGELMVGPYQGPVACQTLEKNKGVCWASVNTKETIIVEDVHKFPDHIACDARSRSEIVIPIVKSDGTVLAVLDVDSKDMASFDKQDAEGLQKIISLISID